MCYRPVQIRKPKAGSSISPTLLKALFFCELYSAIVQHAPQYENNDFTMVALAGYNPANLFGDGSTPSSLVI